MFVKINLKVSKYYCGNFQGGESTKSLIGVSLELIVGFSIKYHEWLKLNQRALNPNH